MLNFTNVSIFLAQKGQYFEIKNIITSVNILCFLWLNNINQEEKTEKKPTLKRMKCILPLDSYSPIIL